VNFPGCARSSSISSRRLPARMFFDVISTSGTSPVTAMGSKSSTEYLIPLASCGTITVSEV
jgi:hypothetical protein